MKNFRANGTVKTKAIELIMALEHTLNTPVNIKIYPQVYDQDTSITLGDFEKRNFITVKMLQTINIPEQGIINNPFQMFNGRYTSIKELKKKLITIQKNEFMKLYNKPIKIYKDCDNNRIIDCINCNNPYNLNENFWYSINSKCNHCGWTYQPQTYDYININTTRENGMYMYIEPSKTLIGFIETQKIQDVLDI